MGTDQLKKATMHNYAQLNNTNMQKQ